ncbi:MAG: enolase C-terminal domain-like protein, partial [Candidatus Hydrogenedentales bacterium]
MKFARARYFRYALRLKRPLELRGRTITKREGYIIALESGDGAIGYGEIAPLPGFSFETMESSLVSARHVVDALKKSEYTLDAEPYAARPWDRAFASVRFGVETAILHLHAQAEGKSLGRLLNPRCRDAVSLNALLLGTREDVLEQAARRLSEGYRTFKLKIGRGSVDEDIATVRAVREAIGEGAGLRLDANQAWVYEDAVRFARGL